MATFQDLAFGRLKFIIRRLQSSSYMFIMDLETSKLSIWVIDIFKVGDNLNQLRSHASVNGFWNIIDKGGI